MKSTVVGVIGGCEQRGDSPGVSCAAALRAAAALRFAPAGSVIVIAAREGGPDLSIEVRDAGPGFPEDFLPHAFERFRRPDAGRSRDGGGSGLGLAIAAAIAVAHGGTAAARNGPGGGAVISLRLPGTAR